MAITLDPRFPTPDRSRQTLQRTKDDDGVIDIGWSEGVFSDGRAFRAEMWAQDQISMLTVFFAQVGLENLDPDQLKALALAEGLVSFKPGERQSCEVRPFTDDAGAPMWSLNFVVGDDETTRLDASIPVWRHPAAGPPATLFSAAGLWRAYRDD